MSKYNSSFGKVNILRAISKKDARVHFVGAGGVSVSALMCLSSFFGIRVSGEDRKRNRYTEVLAGMGADVTIGEGAEIGEDVGLVVYSLAVGEDNKTLLAAEKRGIPAVSRAEYMNALSEPYRTKIGVSGSHGKSTTVGMLHAIFKEAGKNPTTLSGARLSLTEEHFYLGALDYFIYEGCEYKDSFLCFEPDVSVFLNLELDHTDYFESEEGLTESFTRAVKKAKVPIVNTDDGKLREIAQKLHTPPVKVGKSRDNTYSYEVISAKPRELKIKMYKGDLPIGDIDMALVGSFNITNAACAVAAALECKIPFECCARALSSFSGIGGRLELVGEYKGRRVYLDYAHHPTEIKAGISAVKDDTGGAVTVIFGPHTYSRTASLWDGFVSALSYADCVVLTEIDGVREREIEGISSARLADAVGGSVCKSPDELKDKIEKFDGAIIVMGAIDMSWVVSALLNS